MRETERTLRRLDPLGSLASRPLTLIGAVAAPLVALLSTLATSPSAGVPVAAVLALAFIALAGLVLAITTSPHRTPAGRGTAATVIALALAASVTSSAAFWMVKGIGQDWGPIATALLVLALSTYRPAREILTLGGVCSLVFVLIAVLQGGDARSVTIDAIAAVTPVLALSLGGAAFAATVVRSVEQWQRQEATETGVAVELMRRSNPVDERRDRVGILNHEVAPLFSEILSAGTIDRGHQARASAVAQALRSVMVLEADRSWLDQLAESLPAADEFSDASVIDDDRRADDMTMEQRAAMRAILVTLADPDLTDPGSLQVLIRTRGAHCDVTVTAESGTAAGTMSHLLDPYISVLAALFDDVAFDIASQITLRFSYDRL
ncbi:hypothetical protein [Naasia lichenicola]|uniref:Uncharacterized protein n=1 Tax=Naasia lichenicola TaxID=2565933 RepID=A0A4S4FKM5_9MICO|nr:hypothetical protein [Naasia lichenicola]THG30899.1 hypothetical protein E6C64_09780 [Naasia lichenicola]